MAFFGCSQFIKWLSTLMYIVANANLDTFHYELTNWQLRFNCKEYRITVQTPLKNNPTKLKQEEDNNCRSRPGFSRVTTMWRTCSHSSKKENQGLCSHRKQQNTTIWHRISICRSAVYTRWSCVRSKQVPLWNTHMKAAGVAICGAAGAQRWGAGQHGELLPAVSQTPGGQLRKLPGSGHDES